MDDCASAFSVDMGSCLSCSRHSRPERGRSVVTRPARAPLVVAHSTRQRGRSSRQSVQSNRANVGAPRSRRTSTISGSSITAGSALVFSEEPARPAPDTSSHEQRRHQRSRIRRNHTDVRDHNADHVGRWWLEHASLNQLLARALSHFGGHDEQDIEVRDIAALMRQIETLESDLADTRERLAEERNKTRRYRRRSATLMDSLQNTPAQLSGRIAELEGRDVAKRAQALDLLDEVMALKHPVHRLDVLINRITVLLRT
ncbi:hypothetical protein BJ166DRAFT_92102 [Pestalotiopsis sp. NC0098]|nr:hypothetical protein BJ166DRAFT_92102 [Pestalotiopsis sp. NC0098]